MAGVCVVGAAAGGAELAVAPALGLRVFAPWTLGVTPDGVDVALALPRGGTPMVAARHAGTTLDPRALAGGARAALTQGDAAIALGGGPLAPLTARYAVRDLARELELPALVAVAPEPGFPAVALAAVSVLRAAGVAVVAIAVVPWPEPPSREQLDERAALGEVADVPVEVVAPSGRLDPSAWSAGARPAVAPAHTLALEPYRAWGARPVGDPRATARPQIMAAMLEIVGAEGPMTASRAYALYNRASGRRKLTSVARAPLSSAIYWLAQEGKVVLTREAEVPWQADDLVRLPDAPAVAVRELGPRDLSEVPLDEIAELVRRLRGARGISRPDQLKRAVLDAYGLIRMTSRADEYLGLALGLAEEG